MRGLSLACLFLLAGSAVSQETTESSVEEVAATTILATTTAPVTTSRPEQDIVEQVEEDEVIEDEDLPVVIIKQINEINEDGSYTVGYEASDGSFKLETKDAEGNVEGKRCCCKN